MDQNLQNSEGELRQMGTEVILHLTETFSRTFFDHSMDVSGCLMGRRMLEIGQMCVLPILNLNY
jgi:hypothetical protein